MRVAEQAGALADRRNASTFVDHRQPQLLAPDRFALPDSPEEALPLGEAAEADVLAVVRRRRRVSVARRKRLHRAAEGRPHLVENDLVAPVDQLERGGEARETAADDCRPHRNEPATIRSLAGTEICGLPS